MIILNFVLVYHGLVLIGNCMHGCVRFKCSVGNIVYQGLDFILLQQFI